ncbi:MAG: hypothetical protein JW941_04505 [Candidatus Coatesbacteria bacterium]|nr:hypothetical protein [Candidatus Coatesbacteria bacterium]
MIARHRTIILVLAALISVFAAICVADSNAADPNHSARVFVEFSRPVLTQVGASQSIEVRGCEQIIEAVETPRLPYKTISLKLPYTARITELSIENAEFDELTLASPIQVSDGPMPLADPALFTPETNPDFVASAWFPADWARMYVSGGRDVEDWNFKKFVTVCIYPVRYLADEMKAQSLRSAVIGISYTDEVQNDRRTKDGDDDVWDLLIIAPDEFADILTGFVTHKNLLGVRTVLVTLGDAIANPFGEDDAAKLKYFISEHVKDHGTRYVLGVGDADLFPVRYAEVFDNYDDYSNVTDGRLVPADLYYADLFDSDGVLCTWDTDGDGIYGESSSSQPNADHVDLMPDVMFSRLPAGRAVDLGIMVSQIINYELNIDENSPNFERAVLCGSVISGPDAEGEYACEQLASDIFSNYSVARLYTTTTFDRNASLSDRSVISHINEGCGFATYIGHGTYEAFAFGMGNYLFSDQISDLTNADVMPFITAPSCETAGFDNENWEHPQFPSIGDSIGEQFLNCVDGGAIAYTGATRVAYGAGSGTSWNLYYAAKLSRLMLKAYKDGHRSVGEMFLKGLEGYINSWWSPSVYDVKTVMEYVSFGDPSLQIGGPVQPLEPPIHVGLSVPRFSYPNRNVGLEITCMNNEGAREVLFAIAFVSAQGEVFSYPDWTSGLNLIPFTLESGFALENYELTTIDTSVCPDGSNAFYIMLFDPETLEPCSNLGGSCLFIK